MGPDEGVQRVLKVGTGTVGFYGFAGALWTSNGTFYAEARVFVRGSSPEVRGAIDTVRVAARDSEIAIELLRCELEERFGRMEFVSWMSPDERSSTGL